MDSDSVGLGWNLYVFTEQCLWWGNTTPPCFSSLALICPSWQFFPLAPSGFASWCHLSLCSIGICDLRPDCLSGTDFGMLPLQCALRSLAHTPREAHLGAPPFPVLFIPIESRVPGPFGEGGWAVQCGCGNRHCPMETVIWVLSDMCDGAYYPDDQASSVWQLAI